MQSIQANIMCFVEHNLAVDQSDIRFGLHKQIKRHFPSSRAIPSTSEIPFATPYKPGGCLLITDSCPTSRITEQGTDTMGRWSYVLLATQQTHQICVITTYKPCHTSIQSTGPLTVYRQQWTTLRSLGTESPDPRAQYDKDLLHLLKQHIDRGHQIILTGDFNSTKQSSLFPQLYDLGLRDMITDRHFNLPSFRSYQRGNSVIDYALCSLAILPSVQLSTYEPFHYSTHSDHRGIIIDFDKHLLLGHPSQIQSPAYRGLRSTNEDQVDKYLKYLSQYWTEYNITIRVDQAANINDKTRLRQVLDSIDNDITNAFLKAERKVRLKDRPPWSPQIQQASLLVKRYQLMLEEFKKQISNQPAIHCTTQRITTTNLPCPTTQPECQRLLRKAQKHLKRLRKKAQELRAQHLEVLIERYRLNNDHTRQQVIRRIQKAESIRKCYNKLRWILHPPHPGVTFIQRITESGTTETVYDRLDLETAILHRNRQHFNQCAGTPFTVPPLTRLNWAADSSLADAILTGDCDTDRLTNDRYTGYILRQCKRRVPELDLQITGADLTGLFKAWNEKTSTSPSGRHLGMYKSIFCNSSDTAQPIANTLLHLINLLLKQGLSLTRWRTVSNMMIHKVEGSYFINKLRVIHLFEADYNGTIGLLFNRKLLYQAEQHGVLNNNQWGSRPHRQTEDALMLKELTYDLSYCTKTTLATFDNDATGCYDRVPCSMAMLASRRLGATKSMCQLQADTLQHVQHQLRTAFGTSAQSYTSSPEFEIHGQGQGSRAAPPTWVFVSSVLLDCMDQLSYGLSFTCPYRNLHHHRSSDAFVDDVTSFSNAFLEELQGQNVVSQVIHQMQHDASLWNNLLSSSGGKLALHKCLYYVLKWYWKSGIAHHTSPDLIHPTINIQDEHGVAHNILHRDCQSAHRTLGQMKSPIPTTAAQIQLMTRKSNEWLSAIRSAKLNRAEALAAFDSIWFPSISYGLGTTNLSYEQLDTIQRPITNHILPLLGYNRHFPRSVVFGSRKYGGLQLKHLYSDQGVKHITHFIKYFRANNSVGQLVHISLRWVRLIAGMSFCPLQHTEHDYPQITHPWFATLLRFMKETHSTIDTVDSYNPLSRFDDSALMEDFYLQDPTSTDLITLNRCRLYLQVISVSDILNSSGTQILPNCWRGLQPQPSPFLWPRQARPSSRDWRIWRIYLTKCYLSDDLGHPYHRQDLRVLHPLGQWKPTHLSTSVREFYIHPPSLYLYQRVNHYYVIHKPHRTTRTNINYERHSNTSQLPPSVHPIDVSSSLPSSFMVPKDLVSWKRAPRSSSGFLTFTNHIQALALWESSLLGHFHLVSNDLGQTARLLRHPFLVATDGSEDHGKGSFGWVISTPQGQVFASGRGPAYGSSMTSFRAEAYGILSVSRFILQLHRYLHIPMQRVQADWWCDCQSLLLRLGHQHHLVPNPNRYALADHDLELAIIRTHQSLSIAFDHHHLHSHRYDSVPDSQLPLPPRLNRIADTLAKQHNQTMLHPAVRVPLIHTARCQLNIQGQTVTSKLSRRISHAYTRAQSIQHLQHRLGLCTSEIDLIAWEEFGKAFNSFSSGSQRIIRRWIYGFLPTQRRLHRNSTSTNSLCPVCKATIETDLHFLLCQGADSWEETLFQPLSSILHQHPATHWVDNALLVNLRRFLNQQPSRSPHPWIRPAVESQSMIGWEHCYRGMFSSSWICQQNKAAHHGSRLLVKIIKCMFQAVIQRWNARNQCLHHNTPEHHEVKDRLKAKMTAFYELQDKVLPGDRGIFSIPLSEMLEKTVKIQQVFLKQHTSIVQKSVQQQRSKLIRQHRDIATFFISPQSSSS